jgi:hypothetical protein
MVVLVAIGVVVEILASLDGLHGSHGVVGGCVSVWRDVVWYMGVVGCCVVCSCGVVRVGGCGGGCGLGVVSIVVGEGWSVVGDVLGDVAIDVTVGVTVGGVWSILVVVVVVGCRFLPLLKFLVPLVLGFCLAK